MYRLLFLFTAVFISPVGGRSTFHLSFGSCSRQNLPQPLWPMIQASKPDIFAWLGDIVYADRAVFAKIRIPGTLEEVQDAYLTQARVPGYVNLTQAIPIVGVWDDHDMGVNDGGRSVPEEYRSASKALLLDFLQEPPASDRRLRPDGVYTSYYLLPGNTSTSTRTKGRVHSADRPFPGAPFPTPPLLSPAAPFAHLIMLDARFSRDDFADNPWGGNGAAASTPEPQDTLGGSQWEWLEAQLQLGKANGAVADFTIITSGYQMLPPGDAPVTEGWIRHPASLARLLSLLAVHAEWNGRYIFLSGDVHFGELSIFKQQQQQPHLPLSPLFELTSSGMTHSWGGLLKGSISWLLMNGVLRAVVGSATPAGDTVGACTSNLPWGGKGGGLCYYSELNWGEVIMDFGGEGTATATLRLKGATGATQIEAIVRGGAGTGGRLGWRSRNSSKTGVPLVGDESGGEDLAADDARACAATPLVPPQGVTPACRRVLGLLAPQSNAQYLRLVSILLHCAVLGFLGLVGGGMVGLPLGLYWIVSGKGGEWVAKKAGCSTLISHAFVGAVFALYATTACAVFWSVIEQLLV